MTQGYQIIIANCYIHNLNVTTSTNVLKHISERGKADDCSLEDEHAYEILDHDITAAILQAAEKCSI
jgi:hypothetical protein